MKISIIITLYEPKNIDFLLKWLIFMQSFCKQIDFEYIFVDDFSLNINEWSYKIKAFLKQYPWDFFWLHYKNPLINRVTIARNLWAKNSNWEYLLFVDQDIIFHKNYWLFLEKILAKYSEYIIFWWYIWYNNFMKDISENDILEYIWWKENFWNEFDDFRWKFIKYKDVWQIACWSHFLISKNVFLKYYFDEKLLSWWGEDIDIAYRLYLNNYKLIYIPQLSLLNLSSKLYMLPFSIFTKNNYKWLLKSFVHLSKKYQNDSVFISYIRMRLNYFPIDIKKQFYKEINIILNNYNSINDEI